ARLTGEGEKAHRAALADAVRIEGEAQAAAIAAKGSAEAEAMRKKADAYSATYARPSGDGTLIVPAEVDWCDICRAGVVEPAFMGLALIYGSCAMCFANL
ncbi:hypothetical protein ACFW6V_28460, partial [Streptomyces sp. NPDC058734]